MGREVRRVPADWNHPKNHDGFYTPLYGRSYETAITEWMEERQKWAEGYVLDYSKWPENRAWKPKEDNDTGTYEEYAGDAPQASDYMPDWPKEQRTHLQMYEDTSEGTPISPVMETPEELAQWLADTNASAFGREGASCEAWLATINRGWAVSAVMSSKGIQSGVEVLSDMDKS